MLPSRNIDYSTIELIRRVSFLGNHHQKHIYNIEKNFDALVSLIDEAHLIEEFRLLRFSPNPEKELRLISNFIEDRETLLEMLGCYYSLQFLIMNLKALDVLQLDLSTDPNRYTVFRSFVTRTGDDFRLLSGSYMKTLLNIFLPRKNHPDYVACCVGTRVDQDDIDLGIIDRGPARRDILTAAFAELNKEMLKHATALHFHISEHVGTKGYSASINEYHQLLDPEIRDFVLISEMLNSVPILGNPQIFAEFKAQILSRYYYHQGKDNRYHEGYLRGLLGEVRDLISRDPPEEVLNPKDDGLRMCKAIIFALKTWKDIDRNTSIEVLETLIQQDPEQLEQYKRIYNALLFFESFRFIYQLYVVQEEEVPLQGVGMQNNLQTVALAMGYENKPFARAVTQLLIHYQDHLKTARFGAENLLRIISQHLSGISVFYPITQKEPDAYPANIALDLITRSRFFRGVRFWDDILRALDNPDEILLNRFLADFQNLSKMKRLTLVQAYIRWGALSPYTLLSLITIITKRRPALIESDLIQDFIDSFLAYLQPTLDDIALLSRVLYYYPRTMYIFISLLSENQLERFIEILDTPIWMPDVNFMRNKLLELCRLHYNSSYYFKRFISKVFSTYADFILAFNKPKKFRRLADGLFKNLDNFDTIEEKIDKLGSYYDFEFLRLGINTVNGMSFSAINREFTVFSDNFLQVLFDLCRAEVSKDIQNDPRTRDLLAIFTAGGHARSQAFDDDYDLIILLNSDDPDMLNIANQIILKMNQYIIRRSIMPHYRFADRFKHYVTTFSDLKNLFEHPDDEVFIDKSQLLGARLVVGSPHFEEDFEREIIRPFIFDQSDDFIQALINEIKSRQRYQESVPELEIKEGIGGLRDLENLLFILKAQLRIRETISTNLFHQVIQHLPKKKYLINQLMDDYYFLKQVRDLYHLMVSDDDKIQQHYLARIIEPLCKARHCKLASAKELMTKINQLKARNARNTEKLLAYIGYPYN
jgi:hypothetical protein